MEYGRHEYTPDRIEKDGKTLPVYIPADATAPEAKPGSKAGNPHLDVLLEEERKEQIMRQADHDAQDLCEDQP
ncbi:MAG: hypothetical protein V1725_01115 [archaeon]